MTRFIISILIILLTVPVLYWTAWYLYLFDWRTRIQVGEWCRIAPGDEWIYGRVVQIDGDLITVELEEDGNTVNHKVHRQEVRP